MLVGLIITLLVLIIAAGAGMWFHITNPYARLSIFQPPYTAFAANDGQINYRQNYRLQVYGGRLANAIGYIKAGFLILQNNYFGSRPVAGNTANDIIRAIHRQRFNPRYPYLISGDQFSVLYPRNLGVFYNQLLNPNTALDATDWQWRQQIYLQSVLVAIDGLAVSHLPRTTIVPIGPRQAALTQVHPGGIGSDQVYGLFFALDGLGGQRRSQDGRYRQQTRRAAQRVISERRADLQHIYDSYLQAVHEPASRRVHAKLHLASARDGVTRSSSLYDNIICYQTVRLARRLGLHDDLPTNLAAAERQLKRDYWDTEQGFYHDHLDNHNFSSDWLIGFVTGFFDLTKPQDLARSRRTVEYIENHGLADPLPIKYQIAGQQRRPWAVRWFVPNYGATMIWSYWGAQYITLLAELFQATGERLYLNQARQYIKKYQAAIIRDHGFAETFDSQGNFYRSPMYTSIRATGWVVQFEHARRLVKILQQQPPG